MIAVVSIWLTELAELNALTCPLCNKKLANDEYSRAMLELESKVEERYQKQNLEYKKEFEKKLSDLKEQHDTEKKSNVPEKQIAKEEFSNYKYAESMASTPTQEQLIKKIFFLLKQNRSQKKN